MRARQAATGASGSASASASAETEVDAVAVPAHRWLAACRASNTAAPSLSGTGVLDRCQASPFQQRMEGGFVLVAVVVDEVDGGEEMGEEEMGGEEEGIEEGAVSGCTVRCEPRRESTVEVNVRWRAPAFGGGGADAELCWLCRSSDGQGGGPGTASWIVCRLSGPRRRRRSRCAAEGGSGAVGEREKKMPHMFFACFFFMNKNGERAWLGCHYWWTFLLRTD